MSSEGTSVLWFTGLSGAGKSTIGKIIYMQMKAVEPNWVLVDGDIFRKILGNDLGHASSDRLKNAWRLARMCAYLSQEDINVVCCTMSLYPEIWEWNRSNIKGYKEIYIKVDIKELMRRDPKGLYARAEAGQEKNIIGVHLPFNEPTNPDIVLENNDSGTLHIKKQTEIILNMTGLNKRLKA